MNREVRLCLKSLLIGAACVCLLDVVLGGASRLVFFQQRSGKFYRINRAMASADARLFVFGSSHAASHYVPEVLEAELDLSSYNAGVLGQQILFHSTLESIVLERVTPETVILDVDPSTLYETKEAYDRLADLKPFYSRHPEIIGPVLELRAPLERLFLCSNLYQFNSTLVHVLRYAISPQPDWNGYRPDYGVMKPPTRAQEQQERRTGEAFRAGRKLDPVMVSAMDGFAAIAIRKHVRVYFCVSPTAMPNDLMRNRSFQEITAIAARRGVPLLNFRNDSRFLRQYRLFTDSEHLNDQGARLYSKLVAGAIKRQLAMNGTT